MNLVNMKKYAVYWKTTTPWDNSTCNEMNDSLPLLVSITTDGANVLRGKRTGVSARMRSTCNQLLLYSHFISHCCQLELKKTGGKDCQLCKEVNQFLESIFLLYKTSDVITAAFRESVAELSLSGHVSVIRVDGTRWISHTLKSLTNLLNGLPAHIHCYEKVTSMDIANLKREKQKIIILHDFHVWRQYPSSLK